MKADAFTWSTFSELILTCTTPANKNCDVPEI